MDTRLPSALYSGCTLTSSCVAMRLLLGESLGLKPRPNRQLLQEAGACLVSSLGQFSSWWIQRIIQGICALNQLSMAPEDSSKALT